VIWAGVASAGALGAVLRYLVDGFVQDRTSGRIPFGIFVVNVTGCFVAGVAFALLDAGRIGTDTKVLIATGFAGSFTTFSTFAYETLALAENGRARTGLVNLVGSVVAGLVSAAFGLVLGSHL
jgi:fluoride exporter